MLFRRSPSTSLLALALVIAVSAIGLLALPEPTFAQTGGLVPQCALQARTEPPSIACVLETFANLAQLILGITGSAALLAFVYGGFLMISSAGDSGRVEKGKLVLTQAVIGIVIILTAGYIVRYGLSVLQANRTSSGSSGQQQQAAPSTPPSNNNTTNLPPQ